jgi:hypothetical protein
MTATVRIFLAIESVVFGAAALMHAGVLFPGHEHGRARIAESVIALVLAAGLAASVAAPAASRRIGLAAQGFALLGTFVGLFTIAIGIGPRTAIDLVLHAMMIALLVSGCLVVARRPHRNLLNE